MKTRSGKQYPRRQAEVRDPEIIIDIVRSPPPVRSNSRNMPPESPPPLVCDNRWVVEDVTDSDEAVKTQGPKYTDIKIRHNLEEIKTFAKMKHKEYWDEANLRKTKEASSNKPATAQEKGHSSKDQERPLPSASGDGEHGQCEDRDNDNQESQHNAEDGTAGLDDGPGRSESTGEMEMSASASQRPQDKEVPCIDISSDDDLEANTDAGDRNSKTLHTIENSRKRKLADLVTRGGPSLPPKIIQRWGTGHWVRGYPETLSCGMVVSQQTLLGYSEEITLPTTILYAINKQVHVKNLSWFCTGKCVYSLFNFEGSGSIKNIQFGRIVSEDHGFSAHAVVTFAKPCDAQKALTMGLQKKLFHLDRIISVGNHCPQVMGGRKSAVPRLPPLTSQIPQGPLQLALARRPLPSSSYSSFYVSRLDPLYYQSLLD